MWHQLLLGGLLLRSGVLGELSGVGDELGLARNEPSQNLGDSQTIVGLVVLQNAAQGSLGGAKSGVEAVDVLLLSLVLLLDAASDLKVSGLVIGTVGARNKLLVLLLEGEPSLEIILLGGGVVQLAGDNGHNSVGKTQRLVELLGGINHSVKLLPRLFGVGDAELLNLLKLVDSEDSPGVLAVRASLTSETGGVASVSSG